MPNESSNTGKIVVKKRIVKIEKGDPIFLRHQQQQLIQQQLLQQQLDPFGKPLVSNGKILQRKKKGRLYSLGGNEPAVRKPRGRLDRLKTVGTFDLGNDVTVLTEVARNLNEHIISSGVVGGIVGGDLPLTGRRRLSTLPATKFQGLSGISTPSSDSLQQQQRREFTPKTIKGAPSMDQFKNKLNNSVAAVATTTTTTVRTQHSADDCIERSNRRSMAASVASVKFNSRSLSSGASRGDYRLIETSFNEEEAQVDSSGDSSKREDIDFKDKNCTNIVNTSIRASGAYDETTAPRKYHNQMDNDSDKIELDICSAEVINKCDNTGGVAGADDEDQITFRNTTRKPVLRKSKRIVRSDSECLDDESDFNGRVDIVLLANEDIQIHHDPGSPGIVPTNRCRSSTTSSAATNENSERKESSDIDDLYPSSKDILHKSTDDSSRNMSTDELDTVFSDTTDLEQLEREYRELAKSSLQREYKSDGDTLDEVGKKRNEFLKWKNQSFENNFELYDMDRIEVEDDGAQTPTTSSSNNRPTTEDSSPTPPVSMIISPTAATNLTSILRMENIRPNKLEISNCSDGDSSSTGPMSAAGSSSKDGIITSLFEKRFGKIKKINKLLKCKRFSTSALYDKKSSEEQTKSPPRRWTDIKDVGVDSLRSWSGLKSKDSPDAQVSTSKKDTKSDTKSSKMFRSKFTSPAKKDISESKSSIYSSKLSLFNSKSIFAIRRSPMFSNASHSNTELNVGGGGTASSAASSASPRTRLTELSKSNSELNNKSNKSSPSRFGGAQSKRPSIKESTSITDNRLLTKPVPVAVATHSPLSEEFYNKTGSVRLSAMELYEKFCSEDFGGLYKHEKIHLRPVEDLSCGGYKNWHEYRLGQRGLGVSQKYIRAKNAKLLRQKSEPKFSFRDDSYFPEEEDENIYEEELDDGGEGEEEDEYEDEEEEGDYYEDEEDLADEEGESFDEHESAAGTVIDEVKVCSIDHHQQNSRAASVANDSEVDEIFLVPAGSKCTDDYDEYGFENKQFSLEQSMMVRSSSQGSGLNHIVEHFSSGARRKYSYSHEVPRELSDFGTGDEILTIYKICSKDDILLDAIVEPITPVDEKLSPDCVADEEILSSPSAHVDHSVEYAISEYVRNAAPDGCSATLMIRSSDSMELLSSSSGTLRSGSTLTEYAFDTVRHLNMDSCSTSKLSLSIKSEIFDDYTVTPTDCAATVEPVARAINEDFTLTPDGSLSEPMPKDELLSPEIPSSVSSSEQMIEIVDTFLSNERCSTFSQSAPESFGEDGTNYFSFDCVAGLATEGEQLEIVDLDNPSVSPKDLVSDFTTEITKEFDLLFSRANDAAAIKDGSGCNMTETTLNSPAAAASAAGTQQMAAPMRMASRYSMQCLEPYVIAEITDEGAVTLTTASKDGCCTMTTKSPATTAAEFTIEVRAVDEAIRQRIQQAKLKKIRSQSLGNLSNNKTRCFPL